MRQGPTQTHVWIRLIGDTDEHLLPDGVDFESFRTLPDSSWVDLGDGRWCRMNAIAEARSVVEEESDTASVESVTSDAPDGG
jgi:hypothetical protein